MDQLEGVEAVLTGVLLALAAAGWALMPFNFGDVMRMFKRTPKNELGERCDE